MRFLLMLTVMGLLGACTKTPKPPPFNPQAEARRFPGIEYRLTGGFSGGEDRITITADGRVTSDGKRIGKRAGQASEFQLAQLARLLENWDELGTEYPPPDGAADTHAIEITYRGKRVAASDANPSVPAPFKLVRARIESLAGEMKPAQ